MAEPTKTTIFGTQKTEPKKVVVAPKPTKPIEVKTQPTQLKKEVNVLKDPKGVFDYSGCQTHVVEKDETLFSIAQKYTVAMQQLRYFNHIKKDNMNIRTGQTLVIPKKPIYVPYGK